MTDTIQTDPQIARVLDQAADTIKAYGLLHGSYWASPASIDRDDELHIDAYRGSGSCCTIGAIAVALGHTANHDDVDKHVVRGGLDVPFEYGPCQDEPAHPAVVAVMHHLDFVTVEELWSWSDHLAKQGRDAEVIHTLRQCAAFYRGVTA